MEEGVAPPEREGEQGESSRRVGTEQGKGQWGRERGPPRAGSPGAQSTCLLLSAHLPCQPSRESPLHPPPNEKQKQERRD